ncbi:MAG: M48 family peptidase [Actinobacteria bacterium]|nr:M48 family peptidase [Actinomycetota bacterium]
MTGRQQLTLLPERLINSQAVGAYKKIKEKAKLIEDKDQLGPIVSVGQRIEKAIKYYFKSKNLKDPTENYDWEYILINDPKTLNAWCMPGGKIAFYSGILEVTKDENGLAAVMGHEIAHAVARHSLERASAALAINVGTMAADIALGGAVSRARNTVGQTTGMDIIQLGIFNPFSRYQESEADYLGIIFANLSGYDPAGAIQLWERMQEKMKGKELPQFLSTHPSSGNRINDLRLLIPKVKIEYPKIQDL